jgi:hypothetical protein
MNLTQANGHNVEVTVDGSRLTIVVDLSKDLGPSRSGKTRLIASTNGNFALPDGSKLGLNVYRSIKS